MEPPEAGQDSQVIGSELFRSKKIVSTQWLPALSADRLELVRCIGSFAGGTGQSHGGKLAINPAFLYDDSAFSNEEMTEGMVSLRWSDPGSIMAISLARDRSAPYGCGVRDDCRFLGELPVAINYSRPVTWRSRSRNHPNRGRADWP